MREQFSEEIQYKESEIALIDQVFRKLRENALLYMADANICLTSLTRAKTKEKMEFPA